MSSPTAPRNRAISRHVVRLNPAYSATQSPPVMEARRWLTQTALPADLPLINVSQAAPVDPPPEPLRRAMATAVMEAPQAHLYGPVLGLPELRDTVAERWSRLYGGAVSADQVAITAGCNEAFAAAVSTLAGPGDEILLPVPWYFNHKMWLDMSGIRTVALPTAENLLPDPQHAAQLLTARTRAIVLVTPNNPGGVEYPPDLLAAFLDLARERDLALIVDETYRDFLGTDGAPHRLFDGHWDETLIHLYSFSKAYRLTGHRTGALIAAPGRLSEIEKFLDTVTICPPQLGQIAALWGLRNLDTWLAGERAEILARRAAVAQGFHDLPGWQLLGCGAYFAYVTHPFKMASDTLAPRLLAEASILCLPGTMFAPEADTNARNQLRFAFANVDGDGIAELFRRLRSLDLPRH